MSTDTNAPSLDRPHASAAPGAPRDWSLRNRLLVLAALTALLGALAGGAAVLVLTGEPAAMRDTVLARLDRTVLGVAGIAAVLLIALLAWTFARVARPFDAAAHQLVDRRPEDPRPLDVADPPRELRPVIDALNALFRRFDRALRSERHFTAAAAHELRTALAAVRVQAQVAARTKPADVPAALDQLGVCVDRASRLVEQLLTLARIDVSGNASTAATAVRLEALASRIVAELQPLLEARGIDVAAELHPAEVVGLEFGLAALVRNLVDNAARYCPPQGRVRVRTGQSGGEAVVTVDDSGPGIAPHERERVFTPFTRLQAEDTDGVGVGLSIVRSVAAAHGGRVVLADSELGGLRVTVYLSTSLAADPGATPPDPPAPPPARQ